ncbi:a-factor receptor [Tulasnella sp. 424]|nr:a-factor receptor [Tulasnella sp. 424]
MAMASTEIICSVPMSIYFMVSRIKMGILPWISWADTHLNFNRVEVLPFGFFQLHPESWIMINMSRYLFPLGSFFFFVYLGMSGESGTFYRRQFWRFARLLGFSASSQAAEASPEVPWIARPGVRAPSRLRSLPPFVTSVSVTSTPKKKQSPLELKAYGTGSNSNSSSGSLSVPPDPKVEKESAHDSWQRIALTAEVHSNVV